jgi:hypothetical protein
VRESWACNRWRERGLTWRRVKRHLGILTLSLTSLTSQINAAEYGMTGIDFVCAALHIYICCMLSLSCTHDAAQEQTRWYRTRCGLHYRGSAHKMPSHRLNESMQGHDRIPAPDPNTFKLSQCTAPICMPHSTMQNQ